MYYVYAHTKSSGEIFYIGKGKDKRAYDKDYRNKHWNHIVNKHGFKAIILAEFESEKQALDEEALLISYFRKFNTLTNVLDSGYMNPMSKPEAVLQMAATKRAKGQYDKTSIIDYNSSFKERMKDPFFAKQISDKRKIAAIASHAVRKKNGYGKISEEGKQKRLESYLKTCRIRSLLKVTRLHFEGVQNA